MNVYNRPGPTPEQFARMAQSSSAPMTPDQAALLRTLSKDADVTVRSDLTQLQAHEQILALKDMLKTNR